ncbi:MAG: TIGR00730 family Rossman fold protein [Chloroflexi bacterium]|nr:TIGR00730 family Rossman fold protein [Chloroflexota bacterium]
MKRICVFCGSTPGVNDAYVQGALVMGNLLASAGIDLVYGGGRLGVMGAIADAVLAARGTVIGVIPESMNVPRVVHEEVTETIVVGDMHVRKAKMSELSDAFIALPGGMGTFEELFETLTWSQLGYQPKPIGVLNIEGYYDPLVTLIEHGIEQGFIKPQHRQVFAVDDEPAGLLAKLQDFEHPATDLWSKIA